MTNSVVYSGCEYIPRNQQKNKYPALESTVEIQKENKRMHHHLNPKLTNGVLDAADELNEKSRIINNCLLLNTHHNLSSA